MAMHFQFSRPCPFSSPCCDSVTHFLSSFLASFSATRNTNPAAGQWHVVCRVRARQLQCLHRTAAVPVVSVRHVSARQRQDGLPAVPGGIVSGRRQRVRVSPVHGRHLHGRLGAAAVHGVRSGEVWPYALVAVSSRPFIPSRSTLRPSDQATDFPHLALDRALLYFPSPTYLSSSSHPSCGSTDSTM